MVVAWLLALVRAGPTTGGADQPGPQFSTLATAASWVVVAFAMVGLVVPALDVRLSLRFILIMSVATFAGRVIVAGWIARRRRLGELADPGAGSGEGKRPTRTHRPTGRDRAQHMRVVAVQVTDGSSLSDLDSVTLIPLFSDPSTRRSATGCRRWCSWAPLTSPRTSCGARSGSRRLQGSTP